MNEEDIILCYGGPGDGRIVRKFCCDLKYYNYYGTVYERTEHYDQDNYRIFKFIGYDNAHN